MSWNTKIPARLIDFENKTHPNTDYCIGVKMISSGGGSGTWLRVDEKENVVDIDSTYFANHPIYSNITTVQMDGNQVMVKIPKFYIRTEEGKKYWISDTQREGFRLHPAFIRNTGEEVSHFFVGAYQGSIYNGVCCSESGVTPTVYTTFTDYQKSCTGRNSIDSGISGYHMWTIYEVSAIAMLALVECCSTDFQTYYGEGRVNASGLGKTSDESVVSASYRGIMGLWGNAWQFVDGLVTDNNDMFLIWGDDGKREYKETSLKIVSKASQDTVWVDGKTSGYYNALTTTLGSGYNFNDIFLPDFNTLTNTYTNGSFSDYIYTRTTGESRRVCCVGGDFSSEKKAGLFCYNFDIKTTDSFDNITTRLAKY